MAPANLITKAAMATLATRGSNNSLPCDIYASGGTPCVAAHSTTRALFNNFSGSLYQVKRDSDNTTQNIGVLYTGGVANAASQDTFCEGTTCTIVTIYDQSGHNNNLTPAPPGGEASGPEPGGYDYASAAVGAPVTINGNKAYGVFISPEFGYRIDDTNGIATGNDPEGLYAIFDGSHYNSPCCFDYGNAETSNTDTGAGHMEAIYFGNGADFGTGSGSGPWVMADLENGLYSEGADAQNPNDPSQTSRFVTAFVKGQPGEWAIRGANAQTGGVTTYYDGPRPSGYEPMSKEGSIILGIGGDNSNQAQGTFYEGVMTSGFPSNETENAVQANIVSAGYATTSLVSGPTVNVGDTVTLQVTTEGFNNRYISHNGTEVVTSVITSSSDSATQQSGMWKIVDPLFASAPGCISFESVDTPGSYIRHYLFELYADAPDGSATFTTDATYCPQTGFNGTNTNSFRSWSFPTRYFRHYNAVLYIASNGGPEDFDYYMQFPYDTSFIVGSSFQS